MKKGHDILSDYGSDSNAPMAPRARSGGEKSARDVMNYEAPQGPLHIMDTGVGLRGGRNVGRAGTQGPHMTTDGDGGSPGLHGTNKGNAGSQGKH